MVSLSLNLRSERKKQITKKLWLHKRLNSDTAGLRLERNKLIKLH